MTDKWNFNLDDLTIDNIGSWPLPFKVLAIALTLSFICFMSYSFYIKEQLRELESKQKNEVQLRHEFENKQAQAANLEAYKKQLMDVEHIFKELLRKLPSRTEVPGLLEDISKIGVVNGLTFLLFDPQDEVSHEFYVELPIKIIVVGDYHQLGSFVSDVASLDRIVTIHNVHIGPNYDKEIMSSQAQANENKKKLSRKSIKGSLQMEITAKTYRYRELRLDHEKS